MKNRLAGLIGLVMLTPAFAATNDLPFIDAHSQFDDGLPVSQVLQFAARAGVSQILLSARGRVTTGQVLELAAANPTCIVPSLRTKGRGFDENRPSYYKMLDQQFKAPAFKAMSEIILVHAPKGTRAPEVNVAASEPQVIEVMERAFAKGWPVVLHYEFRWLAKAYGTKAWAARMVELKSLVSQYPQQQFALIHMAQLDPPEAGALLAAHPNLVFLTSHANTLVLLDSNQPWTNMFDGQALSPEWKALLLRYPDRFVFAIDNVWPEHWSEKYVRQVEFWRNALNKLPNEVAHAIAHGNAERLWGLAPAKAGQVCGEPQPSVLANTLRSQP